jgi:hypothetical protein
MVEHPTAMQTPAPLHHWNLPTRARLREACHEIAQILRELARKHSAGRISEERFVELLLKIEEEEVAPAGLVLTASNTLDDWTAFKVRAKTASEPCAAFEFRPETGEFRAVAAEGD